MVGFQKGGGLMTVGYKKGRGLKAFPVGSRWLLGWSLLGLSWDVWGASDCLWQEEEKTSSGVGQETQHPNAETSLRTPVQLACGLHTDGGVSCRRAVVDRVRGFDYGRKG